MEGSSMAFVGDSMHELFAHAFMVDWHGSAGTTCKVCQTVSCFGHYHFNCQRISALFNEKHKDEPGFVNVNWPDFSLTLSRNDFLYVGDRVHASNPTYMHHQYLMDWTSLLKNPQLNYSLVVVNRGAHYEKDDKVFIDDVDIALSYIQRTHPKLTVIFRSTTAGHEEKSDRLFNSRIC